MSGAPDAAKALSKRIDRAREEFDLEENPGADPLAYIEVTRGLLHEAEALGAPGTLFSAMLAYDKALLRRPFGDEGARDGSRSVARDRLAVLRRCLRMWEKEKRTLPVDDVRVMWLRLVEIADGFTRIFPEGRRLVAGLLDDLDERRPPHDPDLGRFIAHHRMGLAARGGDLAETVRLRGTFDQPDERDGYLLVDGARAVECTMWQRLGADDRALEAIAPVLNGQIRVRDGQVYDDTPLMAYLRTGRLTEAVAAHQKTYALPGKKLEEATAHLEFCARTGNVERGLDVLHRNMHRLEGPVGTYEKAWLRAAAALLCHRVCELGADREWFWSCDCDADAPDADCTVFDSWTYARLGSVLFWQAMNYAEEFDRDDGAVALRTGLARLMSPGPLHDGLELPPGTAATSVPPPTFPLHETARTGPDLLARLAELRAAPWDQSVGRALLGLASAARVAGETAALHEIRLAAAEMTVAFTGWRRTTFAFLDGVVRDAVPGPETAERLWPLVPRFLDGALAHPVVHLNQLRDLLTRLREWVRPGTDDAHHLAWYATGLAARRGDAREARAAWDGYSALPPRRVHDTGADALCRAGWWLTLRCDAEAREAIASHPDSAGREDLLVMALHRAGETARARELHERHWRDEGGAAELAVHAEYCASTGLAERGRELILVHLDRLHYHWNDSGFGAAQPHAEAAVAALCRVIVDAGADRPWTWTCDCCEPEEWTYAKLAEDLAVGVPGLRWAGLGAAVPDGRG